MAALSDLVRRSIDEWNDDLERLVFRTPEPARIARMVEGFMADYVGPVAAALFYRTGVGVVVGLRLVDGREVVLKIHRWQASLERLQAIHEVQTHLANVGLPAPRPILAPQLAGSALVTVEEFRAGQAVPGHDPQVRSTLAEGLHQFVVAAQPLVGRASVGAPPIVRGPGDGPLWPEPHSVRFDFDGTADGAEWIDALWRQGRARLAHPAGDAVIGHFDWRVENLGFRDGTIVAIYDWDSVAAAPEPILVGVVAAMFTSDWSQPDPLPTLDEMIAFVDGYERARGRSFNRAEREILDAANLMQCAYGARCQHSDIAMHPEIGGTPMTTGWQKLLLERDDRALT
jgi:hypothetical protein